MAQDNVRSVIEALLFSSEGPLAIDRIKEVLDSLQAPEIRALLEQMKSEYEAANSGMRITEVAGGFQMITAPHLAPFLKKLYKKRQAERLSMPALQTLAIIAYKQPVTKLEIESLRNVEIDGMIKGLLDKGLVRVAGRKKAPGRPKVYGTTKQFLEHFGLISLDELPKIENFQTALTEKEAEKGASVAAAQETEGAKNDPE